MPAKSLFRLPHRDLTLQPVHVNYRLYGSIPKVKLKELQKQYQAEVFELEKSFPLRHVKGTQRKEYRLLLEQSTEKYQKDYDHLLDAVLTGPTWLRNPDIASLVGQSWLTLQEWERVVVLAYCIMPNHVHVILQAPSDTTQSIGNEIGSHKKYTAKEANIILGRRGAFWEKDYFDRDVRTGKFSTVLNYVLHNPVAAKLCEDWTAWPYTYVNPILSAPAL